MGQKSINDNFSLINYIIYLIKFAVIIAISGFLGYYLASNKDDIYQYVSQKYEKLSSYKLEVFDNYFSQESNKNLNDKYRNSETSDEINYNYAGNDFPKKCDDEDVLNIIYKYAENSKKRLCLTVPYFMNLPMSQMFQKCGIGISSSNVNSNLNLKHIVKLEYNEKTDFVKCKGVMYADFGEYGMSGGREITYTIEKTTENLPYVSISPGRLFQ
jgi:hypothetical protein